MVCPFGPGVWRITGPDVVGRVFARHLTLAKMPEMPFHSLRHTFASFAIAAGIGPKTL